MVSFYGLTVQSFKEPSYPHKGRFLVLGGVRDFMGHHRSLVAVVLSSFESKVLDTFCAASFVKSCPEGPSTLSLQFLVQNDTLN